MDAVLLFNDRNSYENYVEQESKARLARHAAERLQQLQAERQRRRIPRPRLMPSSEETCRRISDIVSREDVRRLEEHTRRFARNVCFVSGGAPGLGLR